MQRRTLLASALLASGFACLGARPGQAADGVFTTSDGVRLHYLQAGRGHTIILIPGWTMPAWIFAAQIAAWSRTYHVVALDPRSQGESDIAPSGHEPFRRGRDIAELIEHLGVSSVLLLGWSLGVLDVLSYQHQFGDRRLAGLVLVDNSVGEDPAPVASHSGRRAPARPVPRAVWMRSFVRGMFAQAPPHGFVERLTEAALRTPPEAAAALLAYPVPRSFWKEALFATDKPILYMVTPKWSAQAASLEAHRPNASTVVMRHVGHAMFVDDPRQFDQVVTEFIRQRLWA